MGETFRFVFWAALFSLALMGAATLLTGCAATRTLYHAAKDGSVR